MMATTKRQKWVERSILECLLQLLRVGGLVFRGDSISNRGDADGNDDDDDIGGAILLESVCLCVCSEISGERERFCRARTSMLAD